MKSWRKPLAQGLFFTVFWTAAMLLWGHIWSGPLKPVQIAITICVGILVGAAWTALGRKRAKRNLDDR